MCIWKPSSLTGEWETETLDAHRPTSLMYAAVDGTEETLSACYTTHTHTHIPQSIQVKQIFFKFILATAYKTLNIQVGLKLVKVQEYKR